MHINVKNIILAKLIAQYFNLIISENRKNVVKSFPFAGAPAPESSALSAGSIHSAVRVHMTMTRGWWPASWNYCYLYELHFRLRQPNGQTFQRECSRLLPPLFYYSCSDSSCPVLDTIPKLAYSSSRQLFAFPSEIIICFWWRSPKGLPELHLWQLQRVQDVAALNESVNKRIVSKL